MARFRLAQHVRLLHLEGVGRLDETTFHVLKTLFGEPRVTKPGHIGWSFLDLETRTPLVVSSRASLTAARMEDEPGTWWLSLPFSASAGEDAEGPTGLAAQFQSWLEQQIRALKSAGVLVPAAGRHPADTHPLVNPGGGLGIFTRAILEELDVDFRKHFHELVSVMGDTHALAVMILFLKHVAHELSTSGAPPHPSDPASDEEDVTPVIRKPRLN